MAFQSFDEWKKGTSTPIKGNNAPVNTKKSGVMSFEAWKKTQTPSTPKLQTNNQQPPQPQKTGFFNKLWQHPLDTLISLFDKGPTAKPNSTPLTPNTVVGSVFQGSPATIKQGGIDKPYNPPQVVQTIQDTTREGLNTYNRIGAGLRSAARSGQLNRKQGKPQSLKQDFAAAKQGYLHPESAPTGEDIVKSWGWQNHPGPQLPLLGTPRQIAGGIIDFATNPLSIVGIGIGGKIAGSIGGKLAPKLPQRAVQLASIPAKRGTEFATVTALEAVSKGEPVLPAIGQGFIGGAALGGLEKGIGGIAGRIRTGLAKGKIEPIEPDAWVNPGRKTDFVVSPTGEARSAHIAGELPPADVKLLPPARRDPDFTADAFGNVNIGKGPAGWLPPANIAKPRKYTLPYANDKLRQAINEYNQAIETIQNHFGTNELRADEMARIKSELGIDLEKLIGNIEAAEQKAGWTLKDELQSKKIGLGPATKNFLGPKLQKPSSIPVKEVGQVDWRLGKPMVKPEPTSNLEPPLQFKQRIAVKKPLESPLRPPEKQGNINNTLELPTMSSLDQVTAKHRQEVSSGLSEAKTPAVGQGLKVIGGSPLGQTPYKPVVPEVENALRAGQKPAMSWASTLWQKLHKIASDMKVEPTLDPFPRVREHIRYAKEIPSISRMESTDTLEGILGDIDRAEMDLFTKKVVYEDWLHSVKNGEKIPFDLTEGQVSAELANVNQYITPKLQRAYERHLEVVQAMADDLIARGKLSRGAVRENYYPHKVLFDYSQLLDERFVGLPQKLKTPFRGYVQRRTGSTKPIATDYIETMHNLITKVKIDNAIDDAITNLAKIGEAYTESAGVPKEIIDKVRRTGISETYNGKTYKAWQPDTGNYFYPSLTITEDAVQKALAEQLPAEVQTILGEALKEGLVVGRKKPTYVLPAEVADRLNNFRKSNIETEISKALQDYTQWWKRLAVLVPGLKHDWFNLIGDLDRFTTGLGTKELPEMLVKASKLIKDNDPQLKEMLRRGVFSSEVYIYNTGKYGSAKLRELSGPFGQIAYYNPLSLYQRWRVYREAIPRIAAQMLNEERVKAGKPITNRFAVNVEGLLPEEAVAKVGRETMIDYNMLSKNTQHARKFWFPFVTWYTQNFKSYALMVAKKPIYGLARIFLPMAALTVWNKTMYPEVEKNLPDYWRENPHLITGISNGQGGYYIIPVPLAGAVAASMVGLQTLPDKVARYLSGEISLREMLKEQGKDIVTGPFTAARDLLTPFVKGPAELLYNKDFRTGFTIVPRNLEGTPEAWKLRAKHMLNVLVPPMSKGMQWVDEANKAEQGKPTTPLLARPFGARAIDPEEQKQKKIESLIYDYGSEEIKNQVRYDFAEAYKRWKDDPKNPATIQAVEKASQRLSPEQVWNIINQIDNPPTKEQRLEEAYKRVPKALRPELTNEIKKVQNR